MLVGAGFFGYMLALLQRRLSTIVASQDVTLVSVCLVLCFLMHYFILNKINVVYVALTHQINVCLVYDTGTKPHLVTFNYFRF